MLALLALPMTFSPMAARCAPAKPAALRAPSLLLVPPHATPPEVWHVAHAADPSVIAAPMLGSTAGKASAIVLPPTIGLGIASFAVLCVFVCLFAGDFLEAVGRGLLRVAARLERWRKAVLDDASLLMSSSIMTVSPTNDESEPGLA